MSVMYESNHLRSIGKLLVTGPGGFVGHYVQKAITDGHFGDAQWCPTPLGWDIRDAESTNAIVEKIRPDSVLHLAAQSFVPRSFENPRETFEINLIGTLNLLQALQAQKFAGRLLYVSSGDVYGQVPLDCLPVDETRLPEPRNPYAASKVAAEQLCLQWHRATGLDVVIARPFNHIGPGQDRRFVIPTLASQVIAIKQSKQKPLIEAGDIDVTRDFTDVRDIVNGYLALLQRGISGTIYPLGSGQERTIRELLKSMCVIAGVDAEVFQDPAKLRPAEQRRMVASHRLINAHTGWQPQIPLEITLNDILHSIRI